MSIGICKIGNLGGSYIIQFLPQNVIYKKKTDSLL